MIAWMAYAALVGAPIAAGALAAERLVGVPAASQSRFPATSTAWR